MYMYIVYVYWVWSPFYPDNYLDKKKLTPSISIWGQRWGDAGFLINVWCFYLTVAVRSPKSVFLAYRLPQLDACRKQ